MADRLRAAILEVPADCDVVRQLEVTGGVVSPSASSADVRAFVGGQIDMWKKVVADAKIPQH